MNDNLENYSLLDNKSTNSHLNYNQPSYNNYQSWSNISRGEIKLSNIDEHGNIQTSEHDSSKLQRLQRPYATFGDVNLSWAKK
jgi:hypothetical protein